MPQHWRTFAQVGKAALWQKVIGKTLAIEASVYQRLAPKTGLMPDFLQLPPGRAEAGLYHPPVGFFQEDEENNGDGNWAYNACRTPWRARDGLFIKWRYCGGGAVEDTQRMGQPHHRDAP